MLDLAVLGAEIAAIVDEEVQHAVAPLLAEIIDLKAQIASQLTPEAVKAMVEDAVSALPPPPVPKVITVEDLAPTVAEVVERAVSAMPTPKDGESVDPAIVRAMVEDAVAALPPPPVPEAVTVEDLAPLVAETVGRAVAALPPPKDGESVDPEVVRAMVNEAVAALTPPPMPMPMPEVVTLEDLAPLVAEAVERAVAALPPPKDGESVDPEAVRAMVATAVAALPPAADGVGLADALIDRGGELVLTMTDGSVRKLGQVVGQDADMPELQRQLREMVDAIPKPRDAFSLEDLTVEAVDDGRTVRLAFSAGELTRSFDLAFPVLIYRGVWREGGYKAGDVVTWAGSLWIAERDTDAKPDTGESWKLAVKRGRDAKPAQLQSSIGATDGG